MLSLPASASVPATLAHETPRSGAIPTAWIGLWAVLGLALALRAACALLFQGAHYPDETFQAFEQGHRYAFGYGLKPWEFEDGLRSTLPPLALAGLFRLGDALFGTPEAMLGLARLALAALSLIPVAAIYAAGARRSTLHAVIGGIAAATWWELVYFSYRPLSEALAADFLLTALALASFRTGAMPRRALLAAGACLGLALMLRVQFAPAVGLIGLALVWGRAERLGPLALGAALPVALFAAADWIAWGAPFHAPVAAFRANTIEGVAALFGTEPAHAYLANLVGMLGLVLVVVGVPLVLRARAYRLWWLTAALILASHSAIPHKEYRFVFVCAPILVVAAAFASADLLARHPAFADARRTVRIALAALLASLWAGCSLAAASGADKRALWLRQAEKVAAFRLLAHSPDLCGLLLDAVSWQETGGYSSLHRDVPIHQRGAGEGQALPSADAFNYVLAHKDGPPLPGFESVQCFSSTTRYDVCVLRRPGICRADAGATPVARLPRLGDPRVSR